MFAKKVNDTILDKLPRAQGEPVFILKKNLSSVPHCKCVKPYQTSKAPSFCLGAGHIFVKRVSVILRGNQAAKVENDEDPNAIILT